MRSCSPNNRCPPAICSSRRAICKVYSRYGKTTAGVEAALLLSQIDFEQGKAQEGVTRLQQVADVGAAESNRATILSLTGDGYAQMGKLSEAAKSYQDAAAATSYEAEKAFQESKAARTYQAAGDTAKSRALWTQLLNDPKAQTVAAEARVRLGELAGQTAKP